MTKKELAIGINGSMLDEQPTGTGVYSFNLINNFSHLDWGENKPNITVFTPATSHLNRDLNVTKLSGYLLSSKHGKLAAFCRFFWNTFCYPVQAKKFDLLISPTTHGSFTLNNQIITIHDLISLRYGNISAHQRFYFRYLLPYMVSKAKLIVAISEATKKDIIEFLKCPEDKVTVIYNGFDHKYYNMLTEKQHLIRKAYGFQDYILAVGPTYSHKNFERLIYSYQGMETYLKEMHPLVIAGGKQPYLQKLQDLVKSLGLEDKIHFLGYVPFEFMPSLYREARILVFPSLHEGFGFPLLEAMACGCPVIASNTSSIPEVCGEAAIYFDPLDTTAIQNSMELLLTDKDLHAEFVKKGIAQAGKFSWSQTAESFKILIDTHFKSLNLHNHVRN